MGLMVLKMVLKFYSQLTGREIMIQMAFTDEEKNRLYDQWMNAPEQKTRIKIGAIYLKSQGMAHQDICRGLRISKHTLIGYLQAYQKDGIAGLTKHLPYRPQSELEDYKQEIEAAFRERPPRSVNEAGQRIRELTGLDRKPTQVRKFMKKLGLKMLKVGMIPARADIAQQEAFKQQELEPRLAEAKAGKRQVFFLDAVHFVHKAFLGFVWCFERLFLPAPAGRQRGNILGALNAVTHELITVANQTYINALCVCELLKKIASQMVDLPVTLVLDNARYQHCQLVKETARSMNIELLFLPSYSPNLNLIERLWKWTKKECLYSPYYETFSDFVQAITQCLTETMKTKYEDLKSLLTLNLQTFEKVQFMAA